ncbi:MAG TPA: response regulator [Candidatus Ozemobacteraceae bacterium]|nr:response regulator [Candidatus Ozemobacteraceae bacterium]
MNESREILVIDDCKNIRLTIQTTLETDGWEVSTAADGEEGFALLKTGRFRVALLDLQLPGMEGIAILRGIRRICPGIAFIIITAFGTVSNIVEAMKLGAIDVLEKPFAPNRLRAIVRECMDRPNSCSARDAPVPQTSGDHLRLAREAMRRAEFHTAEEQLQAAAKLDARNPEVLTLMGVTLEVAGNLLEAQKCYRAALALDPGFDTARRNLERLTLNGGKVPIFLD